MITGIVPCSARASRLASPSSSPSGPHSRASSDGERGRRLDLVAQRRRGAAQRGGLERGDERVADRGARLEAARQRDDGHAVLAGALGERAAGRGDDPRRAGGAWPRRRSRRSPRSSRSSSSTARASPRRSRPGCRSPWRARAGARSRGPSAPAASRPPTDEPPMPATISPPWASTGAMFGGVHAPQRVAQVLGEVERLGELAGGVDGPAGGGVERGASRRAVLRRGW